MLCSLAWFAACLPQSNAAVPLPDHLLYGTIAIDGQPITRANTDVVVEARRSSAGPVIASYRMGSSSRAGDFYYSLRIPVGGSADATPSQVPLGDSVIVSVRAASGVAHKAVHQVTESGVPLRLDFGVGVDTNGDGVPDGWELATLGVAGGDLNRDTDGDGVSDRGEYFAGTLPTDVADVLRVAVTDEDGQLRVSFRALRAAGTGFESRTRYYSLESAADPEHGPWLPLENFSRIPGNDQWIAYSPPGGDGTPLFFRARVWLE